MSSSRRRGAWRIPYQLAVWALLGAVSMAALLGGPISGTRAAQLAALASESSCPQTVATYSVGYNAMTLDLGDVNGDTKLDVVVSNRVSNSVSVAFGNGAGGFLSQASYAVGYEPFFVRLGDFNGDSKLDLATANNGSNSVSVLFNVGNGTFSAATNYAVGANPQGLVLADVNEDGHLDLLASNRSSNTVSVLLNQGAGTFNAAVNYPVNAMPILFDLKDVDKDGHLDIALSSGATTSITVLIGAGSGTFGPPNSYQVTNTQYGTNAVALADFNADGELDLVGTTGGGNSASVLLGTGSGGFGAPVEYPVGSNPVSIAIGDIGGDNVLDIVLANWYTNNVSVLAGNGDGTFQSAVNYYINDRTSSVVLGDLNGDARLDIVAGNYFNGAVAVLLSQPPDLTPPTGSISISQGASATASLNVTLNLSAQDAGCGVATMAFSNDGVSFTAFEPYTSTKAWTLPAGDGSKTVYAKFKDRADNTSQTVSATIVLDQAAPSGSVAINSGAAYTTNRNVTLALPANDVGTGVKQMYLSDGVTSSGWISYTTSAAWLLAGSDGSKTVTARWRDLAGNISAPATDTIVLDTLPPSAAVNPSSSYQLSPIFPITVSGSDVTSGIASYDVQFRDGPDGAWTGWLTATTSTTSSFSGQEGHTYSFRARARDNAGNTSGFSSGDTTTTVDSTAPVADRFLINFGALQTTGVTVSLSIGASDATSGVAAMSFSNDGATWGAWQPYAATAIWSLSAGDGEKTVYGRFRDAAGNISTVASDTIVLNTFVGTDYGLTINNGALFTNQTAVTLTIGAQPGTTQMQVSNDGGFAGVSWEPYTGSKTWQISQYGTYVLPRVVYLRYKDQNGVVSSAYQDDIILDVLPPLGRVSILSTSGARRLASAGVTIELSASDDVSGVAGMRLSNQSNFDGASWQPYATSLAWNMGSGTSVYVQFRDYAGNVSQTYVASLRQPIYMPGIWH